MFRDLRTQLLLWTILPLGAILIVIAYLGVNSHQAAMREMVAERDGVVARVAAAQWSDALLDHARLLSTLDPARCDANCAAFDGGIALFDAQANLLRAYPSNAVWDAPRRRAPTRDALANSFSFPFSEGDALRALVAIPQANNFLVGAFTLPPIADLGFGGHGTAYLVDARGKIIAHPHASRIGEDMSRHAGIVEVMRGESGATFHHADNGAEIVIGYAPIAPTGWGLLVEEPWEEIVAPMFQYSVLLPLMLALAAVVALGAVYFGIRNVIRPLQNLAQAANRIAYGDYRAAEQTVGGVQEIESLRETLDAMARQVNAAQRAMQDYITAMTRGQEDERIRLARELHDDTIQSLIALQQRVEMVEKALSQDPARANEKIRELRELVASSLTSVRRFVRDLRPTYLEELGLIPALEMLSREARASFQIVGEETRLDAERELALYRIAQEALRNVAKHARAQTITLTVTFDTREVAITIEDDGVGFAAPDAPTAYARAGHFGLMGMQERAQLFGGKVYVKSERGKGTKVVAFVPVSAVVG
ncbi:MAG: HAMP domain-containing protein [Chloroflexi bacterium]|nr:HAMP domain-containing protein [Chloroflexota bacterium]